MDQYSRVHRVEAIDTDVSPDTPPFENPATERVGGKMATTGLLSAAALGLSACGGGGSGTQSSGGGLISAVVGAVTQTLTDADAARFLHKAQFSASDSDIASVKSLGYAGWYDAQTAVALGQTGWAWLDSRGYNAIDTNRYYFAFLPGDYMIWNQLITGPDQMRKRLALALSEMMVVSLSSVYSLWPSYATAAYWDVLTANLFGNFRVLLGEVTLNPAMGAFLNMMGNKKEGYTPGSLPDENFAREILQLFTIGLYELNTDGSYKLDSSGNKIETYTQSDITNLARVFTGYVYDYSKSTIVSNTYSEGNTDKIPTNEFVRGHMGFYPPYHSTLAATFLGTTIPANTDGIVALNKTLDTIFNHPNVGPFFARQMIQRLVTSNPSNGYVGRVAAVFNDNGSGVRGDLKAVWKAILTDSEATTQATSATGGKLREPMVRFVQMARTLGCSSSTGEWKIQTLISDSNALGQSPMRSPSVFNFFRPGYVPPNTVLASNGLVAPEFQIVNESTVAAYLNFIMNFLHSGFKDVVPDYTYLLTLAADASALLAWLNLHLSANQISSTTIATLKAALETTTVTATSTDAVKLDRVKTAVFLVMASPEYLVQK